MLKYIFICFVLSFTSLHSEDYVWQEIDELGGYLIRYFSEDSLNHQYLAIEYDIYRSENDGRNWEFSNDYFKYPQPISCSKDGTVYMSIDTIYYSTDAGKTFLPVDDDKFLNYPKGSSSLFSVNNDFVLLKTVPMKDSTDTTKFKWYYMYFRSGNNGLTWDTVQFARNQEEPIVQMMPYFDKKGGMFIIIGSGLYYLKDFNSGFLKMSGFDSWHWQSSTEPNFFTGDSGKVCFAYNRGLLYLNPKTLECEPISVPLDFFYNVRYYKGDYFLLDGNNFYVSHDNLKTVEIIRKAPYGMMLPPNFEITKKGTIIYKDEWGDFFRGTPATAISDQEPYSMKESRDFGSPDKFYDYIDNQAANISGFEIYDIRGGLVLKADYVPDRDKMGIIGTNSSSLLFYKLNSPDGIRYGKVLNFK